MNAFAHAVGKGFRAKDAHFQGRDLRLVLLQDFHDPDAVGDHSHQAFHLEIIHHFDLAPGVARPGGDDELARLASPVVKAEPAVEQSERGRNLNGVALLQPSHAVTPRHAFRPLVKVRRRVKHRHGRPGGSGTHVELSYLAGLDTEQTRGIIKPEIFLVDRGKPAQILEYFEIGGLQTRGGDFLAIKSVFFVGLLDHRAQSAQLTGGQFVPRHRLGLRIPILVHGKMLLPPSRVPLRRRLCQLCRSKSLRAIN